MKQLNRKEMFFLSLTLFSLFFGAGNLIFPPFLGQEAGMKTWIAIAGFILSAVGFPVLAVLVVVKHKGLDRLASRVHPIFASFYTVLIYLSIGPMLGIPRAASLPFEMVIVPFIQTKTVSLSFLRFLFTACFFLLAFLFSLRPNRLIDHLGRFLTPLLLFFLLLLFLRVLRFPMPQGDYVRKAYQNQAFVQGFMDGYLTMDTIAALNFGLLISQLLLSQDISDEKNQLSMSLKAGMRAGVLLTLIYFLLAYLGYLAGSMGFESEHGAQTLVYVMTVLYGPWGVYLLAFIFSLACLTTSIGLLTSISEYFQKESQQSYVFFLSLFTLVSFLIANRGLEAILKISIPILNLLYPIALVLIVLGLLDKGEMPSTSYRLGVVSSGFFALVKLLDDLFQFNFSLLSRFPFYQEGLAWFLPTLFLLLCHKFIFHKKTNK